jgi:formate dehydrogenase subunit gamma
MQIANIVHGVSSFFMMAMLIGHAYMGSIGVKGSFQAMRTGYVDEAWAKDHHELWYDDIKAGRIPAIRSDAPVPTSGAGAAQTRAQ